MAGYSSRRLRGVDERFERAPRDYFRDTRPFGIRAASWLREGPHATVILASIGAIPIVFPWTAEFCLMGGLVFFHWVRTQRARLPMMLPASSGLPDWGDLAPGSNKPKKAEGIMFFGNDQHGEEIWATNDYARRHILILGTTGAGKTEGLVSLATNALGWSSGFLYTDGKGDTSLYSKIYSLCRRYGRDDDLLVLNFMNTGRDGAGESNTLNPFGAGPASALTELLVSLMDDSGSEGGMWKGRAISLMTGVIRALVELRDKREILLDVEQIRDHMTLDRIVELNSFGEQGRIGPGASKSLKAYLESLPGFNWEKARTGKPQAQTTLDQHGYLQMQFTRLLSSLVDVYGYIFKAPLGDIDLYDVVINRRVLVALLPALSKSEDEVGQLGKIIVATLKQMMGRSLGDRLQGDYDEVIGNKPTAANSPFLSILDEVGYYTIPGMAVMPAQARSLGFSMIFAAQDINAMKKKGGAVEKEVDAIIANCNIKIFGKIEDPNATTDLAVKSAGDVAVTQSSGFSMLPNSMSLNYADRRDASVEKKSRIDLLDLKSQVEGEMHMVISDRLIRGTFFYANPKSPKSIEINELLRVRYPDRVSEDDGKEVSELVQMLHKEGWTAAGSAPESVAPLELAAASRIFKQVRRMPEIEKAAAAVSAVTTLLEDGADEGFGFSAPRIEAEAGDFRNLSEAADINATRPEEASFGLPQNQRSRPAERKAEPLSQSNAEADAVLAAAFEDMFQTKDADKPAQGSSSNDDADWFSELPGVDPEKDFEDAGPLGGVVGDLGEMGPDPFADLLEEALRATRKRSTEDQNSIHATLEIGALWVGSDPTVSAPSEDEYDERLAEELTDIEKAAGVPDDAAQKNGQAVAAAIEKAIVYPPEPTPAPADSNALKDHLNDILQAIDTGSKESRSRTDGSESK